MSLPSYRERAITVILSCSALAIIIVLLCKYSKDLFEDKIDRAVTNNDSISSKKHQINNKYKIDIDSIEYKLAAIDNKSPVGVTTEKVNRFRYLLNNLQEKTGDKKIRIADMTVAAQNRLYDNEINESLLNIMEGMNRILSYNLKGQSYAEYISIYIALRSDGRSHEDAILDIISILKSIGVY